MSRRAGLTLLELMISILILVILVTAISQAYVFGANHLQRSEAARDMEDARVRLDDRLRDLLSRAYITADQNDTSTYFLGGQIQANTSSNGNSTVDSSSDRLTFTVLGNPVPESMMQSNSDFETLNQSYGAQGGVTEISIGLSPVGTGVSQQGLFIRSQTPADGDPSQGGYESVLDPDVVEISYEFWDGTAWQTAWDTTSDQRRLPAAVRIRYKLNGDDDYRELTVRPQASDISADNPLQVGEIANAASNSNSGTTGGGQ